MLQGKLRPTGGIIAYGTDLLQSYAPGSICSLRPETSAEEVMEFLRMTALTDEADRPLLIESVVVGES
jgi:hypothetical protein